eukprot:CAMPEP_0206150770 /NCGR_PEP_ID=MMETSP1473-20131121/38472_1 /ASSEMBLY_ACC=CAM_ASM_001109 /TAXON_ID=1461547 /ORGANISM="Stichococcus sp, Strain RCC1054" /LENGTH=94 /DNA_ID=CAMNT_0053548289 /DNA_START=507 /DNA_END=790 /DNA_ORIENTATION=-
MALCVDDAAPSDSWHETAATTQHYLPTWAVLVEYVDQLHLIWNPQNGRLALTNGADLSRLDLVAHEGAVAGQQQPSLACCLHHEETCMPPRQTT